MELRPYQKEAKTAVLSQWEQGNSKTLLVLPTGCGKTIVFAKIATLEQEINAEIDELIRVRTEIEHTISAVADEQLRLILIARYINCKTFEYIACEMHYSYKQICRLHGKALLRVQDVLECPIASVI